MMSKGDALTKTPRKDVKRLRKKSTQSTEKSRREKYVNVFDKMKDKKKQDKMMSEDKNSGVCQLIKS